MTKTEKIHTEYNQKLSLPCCLRDHIRLGEGNFLVQILCGGSVIGILRNDHRIGQDP
jgi:hypothetical protein